MKNNIDELAYTILRLSLGVTFLFTGYFILKHTKEWTGFIKPWAEKLLPVSKESAMKTTAYYDLFNGLWLLSGIFTWWAALFAALHMIQVLVIAGVDDTTYRDIAILGASIALMLYSTQPGFLG